MVAASAPMDDQRGVQEAWEMPFLDHTLSTLRVTAVTPTDKARLLIETDAYAGAWLNALPSPQLRTRHSNEAFFGSYALFVWARRLACRTNALVELRFTVMDSMSWPVIGQNVVGNGMEPQTV